MEDEGKGSPSVVEQYFNRSFSVTSTVLREMQTAKNEGGLSREEGSHGKRTEAVCVTLWCQRLPLAHILKLWELPSKLIYLVECCSMAHLIFN